MTGQEQNNILLENPVVRPAPGQRPGELEVFFMMLEGAVRDRHTAVASSSVIGGTLFGQLLDMVGRTMQPNGLRLLCAEGPQVVTMDDYSRVRNSPRRRSLPVFVCINDPWSPGLLPVRIEIDPSEEDLAGSLGCGILEFATRRPAPGFGRMLVAGAVLVVENEL